MKNKTNKILNIISYIFILIGLFICGLSFKPYLIGLPSMMVPEEHYSNQLIIYYPFWYGFPFIIIGLIILFTKKKRNKK